MRLSTTKLRRLTSACRWKQTNRVTDLKRTKLYKSLYYLFDTLKKFTNLNCVDMFIEIGHQLDHLLSLLHPPTQTFDLLLHTYNPRLTVMKPISLVDNINTLDSRH